MPFKPLEGSFAHALCSPGNPTPVGFKRTLVLCAGIFSFSPLALVIVILCTTVLLLGAKKSAWFNKIITLLNLSVIVFVIVLGSTKVNKDNWHNFFPFGFQGVFQGAGTIFFSYIGFDSVTTLASESANPKRDLPLGIILTLGIATALYVAVSLGS